MRFSHFAVKTLSPVLRHAQWPITGSIRPAPRATCDRQLFSVAVSSGTATSLPDYKPATKVRRLRSIGRSFGANIVPKIGESLDPDPVSADYVSPDSVASEWVKEEGNDAFGRSTNSGHFKLAAVFYRDCCIAQLLQNKNVHRSFQDDDDRLANALAFAEAIQTAACA